MGEALAFPKLCQTLHSPGVAFPRPPTPGFFRNRACVWRGLLRGLGARERCSGRTLSFPPAQPRKPRSGLKKARRNGAWGGWHGSLAVGVGFGGGWDQRGASGGGRQSRVSALGGCFQEKRGRERKGARSREPLNRVKSGECSGTRSLPGEKRLPRGLPPELGWTGA